MRLVLDMDGTLADFWGTAAQRFGSPVPGAYHLRDAWPTRAEAVLAWQADPETYTLLDPLPGALAAVRALADAGHELFVVTARGGEAAYYFATRVWLRDRRVGGYIAGVRSVDMDDKVAAVAGLRPDLAVDDSPYQVPRLRAAGIRTVVIDQGWNRKLDGPRILGWDDGAVRTLEALVPPRIPGEQFWPCGKVPVSERQIAS